MPRVANPAASSTSHLGEDTHDQPAAPRAPKGLPQEELGCGPRTDGTAAIPGAQQGTSVPRGGEATMATGPSILPVVSGASGGSRHAPPQYPWVKLGRTAGMTSGACELSPLARLPPEQPLHPCLHSCGPAAPTQARTQIGRAHV